MDVAFSHAHAPAITLAVTLGSDVRFKGPRQTASRRNGNVATWGLVTVPAGPPAPLEVWAEVVDGEYATRVTFGNGELLAVRIADHTPTEDNS